MANRHSFTEILNFWHLPTWMLIIGYICVWPEILVLKTKGGNATPAASILFLCLVLIMVLKGGKQFLNYIRTSFKEFRSLKIFEKILVVSSIFFVLIVLGCAFVASLFPPHLMQETDALNYHYTLVRQHLILHSFKLIPWASADLFLLPIQFAFAPYWFVTDLPNKFPQFLFVIGLAAMVVRLAQALNVFIRKEQLGIVLLAFMASHNVGIQMGTAMLDLVLTYLFLAALDSFLRGRVVMSAIEFAFYFWSKPFVPLQTILIFGLLACLIIVWRRTFKGKIVLSFEWSRLIVAKSVFVHWSVWFLLMSALIAGPFIAKSLYYANTPLYPFAPGMIKVNRQIDESSSSWQNLVKASAAHLGARDWYGSGRSLKELVKHFWIVAVPEKNVNNRFDYPLGLPYLLCLGPFIWFMIQAIQRKELTILGWFVVFYWASWWMGSQQSRFLYIPVLLMMILTFPMPKEHLRIIVIALFIAIAFNAMSIFRAHWPDFRKIGQEIPLREHDRTLLKFNDVYQRAQRSDFVELDNHEATFAEFPVLIKKPKFPFVMGME
jgi:hypothetical protein